jgi:tetratricopeptide (TPR) repeat protein
MSDPLRTDSARALDAASDADRDAKIEQLLLVGLDHYFAAQYEHAVNVWTRALFLDRSHARARAYIERARSALAERQRESEELLQNGVAAFQRGESLEARRLLQAAIDGGAPADEALAVLDRLDRLETSPAQSPARSTRGGRRAAAPRAVQAMSRPAPWLVSSAVVVILAAGAVGAASWNRVDWRSWLSLPSAPSAAAAAPVSRDITLPLPRRGETTLARANTLALGGRLSDALALLDTIHPTDPARAASDRLRADIQRQLLALSSVAAPDAEARDKTAGRLP